MEASVVLEILQPRSRKQKYDIFTMDHMNVVSWKKRLIKWLTQLDLFYIWSWEHFLLEDENLKAYFILLLGL